MVAGARLEESAGKLRASLGHGNEIAKPLLSGYIPTLDGWRAIAILAVIAAHAQFFVFAPGGFAPNDRLSKLFAGAFGVDIFFGISGFLITSRLLHEQETNGRISLPQFYGRRAFRILPPALVYLLVVGALGSVSALTVDSLELWASAFFFRNYIPPGHNGWFTGHFWSLSVEEHFYLLWPPLLILFGTARGSLARVAALALVFSAWRVVDSHYELLDGLLPVAMPSFRSDVRFQALLWGCWMAFLLKDPTWNERVARFISPLKWWLMMVALLALPLLKQSGEVVYSFTSTLKPMLVAGVIGGAVLMPTSSIGRFLEIPILRWIGRISYSLYLWQQLFIVPLEFRPALPLGPLGFLLLALPGTLTCALISYYFIERPMIRLGARILKSDTGTRPQR